MKKYFLILILFSAILLSAQNTRNNLFEYATGTWCTSCACGHLEINENIAPAFPNTVFIAYHSGGADPFSQFQGNEILNEMGFGALPAGIVDRVSSIMPHIDWLEAITDMSNVPPTVEIEASTLYNVAERKVSISVSTSALEDLGYTYYLSLILLEDNIISPQAGSEFCPGGENFVHNNVARAMLNGSQGEEIWSDGTWFAGNELSYEGEYTISEDFNEQNCRIAVLVYRHKIPLQKAHVQQAISVDVIEGTTPVELESFSVRNISGSAILEWSTATELNNRGFEISRSLDGSGYEKVTFVTGSGTTSKRNQYSFTDSPESNGKYYYKLAQVDLDGKREVLGIKSVVVNNPSDFRLLGNYPNPFNPSTMIKFGLPETADVKFSVYNIAGEIIEEVQYSARPAGDNFINFNAGGLTSGMYLYEISSSFGILRGKMILNK